ncbi:RAD55 family ATPase [Salarchaeum japonicum]|uniref:RAD55 family ATPase n=1 Tax=Salarchaeum japonicum TaxID=555573 RepID=UPI003C70A127
MFDVGSVLPVEEVPEGTNLLVGGPAMSRKRELARSLVERGLSAGEGAVVVTTRDSADRLLDVSQPIRTATAEGRAGVIDCVTRERGGDYRERENVRYVSSPGDLTDIGIRAAGFFKRFSEEDRPVRFGMASLSTMLMYADTRRVFRFMNVLTGRIQQHGWFGATVLETDDRTAFDTFAPLFDGMVQTRHNEDAGRVEVRVLGLAGAPTDWQPL